jgi:hypothetical protein
MPAKCVTCGLMFRTSNELDWHVREEHLQRETPPVKSAPAVTPTPGVGGADQAKGPPPRADGGHQPGATAVESPGGPRWLRAVRRLFGRRPSEPPSGQGRGGA